MSANALNVFNQMTYDQRFSGTHVYAFIQVVRSWRDTRNELFTFPSGDFVLKYEHSHIWVMHRNCWLD